MFTMKWVLMFAVVLVAASSPRSNAKPNILFVLTDDMGWGDVSYNREHYQPGAGGETWTVNPPLTPNIDDLALSDSTMLFRRFYSGSAVCSPTRASILTGRTPSRSCINGAEGCGTSPAWEC
jgi:arylsulfatase A-like enzyme